MMNVLIIGLGSIAKKHVWALNLLLEEVSIYALRSSNPCLDWEGVNNIYNIDDLNFEVNFAIISNPTHLHAYYIRELTERKVPLFIEKPPLANLWESNELKINLSKVKVVTYVACNLRFHPCIAFLKGFITGSTDLHINEVNVYCGSYLPDWRPGQNFKDSYSANAMMGGGVHLDLFHELDYVHWIFGAPLSVRSIKTSKSSLDIQSVDYANYVLNYGEFSASVILNYFRRDPKRSIEILFDNETWTIDLLKNSIVSSTGKIIFFNNDNFEVAETYKLQMQYFIKCLVDSQVPMNSFAESLETLKTCLSDE